MESCCVVVPRERGEEVRLELAERGLLDDSLEIRVDGDAILIPVDGEVDGGFDGDVDVRRAEFEPRDVQRSPSDILGYEPSFEVVGDVALVEDEPREAADAVVEADNNVRSVYRVDSPVRGRERTRDLVHLAGDDDTEVVHREYGVEIQVDLADVYFSPRLAEERRRVASQVEDGERAFDMFAGAGPYSVALALEGAEVVACDVNPAAVDYLRRNAERNGVSGRVTARHSDAREVAAEIDDVDRVVMNLPHTADDFLGSAFEAAGDSAVLHYYDIRHEDDLFDGAVEAVESAASDAGYEVEVLERVVVRSYAPYDYNVCLDVAVERTSR
ncbi:MAG: class I SAM-dependent methyltransferase [Halobacteriota archaeon]